MKAFILYNVSKYSTSGTESYTMPPPALKETFLSFLIAVLIIVLVSKSPVVENQPIEPQYGPLPSDSNSEINFAALIFGAPTNVPIGNVEENASSESKSSEICPVT